MLKQCYLVRLESVIILEWPSQPSLVGAGPAQHAGSQMWNIEYCQGQAMIKIVGNKSVLWAQS